jgi:hypothetical protein
MFHCEECGRDFDSERGLKAHQRKHENEAWTSVLQDMEVEEPRVLAAFDDAPPLEGGVGDMQPGEAPKTSWKDKLWGAPKTVQDKGSDRKPRKKRVATDGVWQTAWTITGIALVKTGADVPVGNCLQFQAPIVGSIIDEAIANTALDKLVQPLAANGEKVKTISSVLALPVLVGVLERNPAAAPMLEPLLRIAIADHLIAMAPVIKEQRKRDEQYRKAVEELGVDMENGEDPIETILASIFPTVQEEPSPNGAYSNVPG